MSETVSLNLNLAALNVDPAVKDLLREMEKAIYQLQQRPPQILEIPIDQQAPDTVLFNEFFSS